MPNIDWTVVWAALISAAAGIGGAGLGGFMSRGQARQQAETARAERVRELGAEGFVAASDAVRWLSVLHVEDSVNPKFAGEYVPKTEAAVGKLRQAATQLTLASATWGAATFSQVAGEAAMALRLLDEAWHDAAKYRQRLEELKEAGKQDSRLAVFYKRQFDKNYETLRAVRERLCGFTGNESLEEELEQGGQLEGSLLYRLRELTSAPSLE